MPTEFDEKFRPLATKLVNNTGVSATIHSAIGTYDPATDTVPDPTADDKSVTASPLLSYRKEEIDGELILLSDSFIYVAAENLDFTPTREMECTHSGTRFKIKNVRPIYSGEQVALYRLQLRANS